MKRRINFILTVLLCCCVAACTRDVDYSGNDINDVDVQKIHIADTMHDVLTTLGTPSYRSTFGPTKFVYIQSKMVYKPIILPYVKSFDMVVISFNENFEVVDIDVRNNMHIQDVENYSKQLHLKGNEINPVQQILGNIGKYNAGAKKAVPGA